MPPPWAWLGSCALASRRGLTQKMHDQQDRESTAGPADGDSADSDDEEEEEQAEVFDEM